MILLRKEAVRLAAFIEMIRMPVGKQKGIIESALLEAEVENVSGAQENFHLRRYLEYKLKSVKNSYIERMISEKFDQPVTIEGQPPRLLRCFCCGYKTLDSRGHFHICPVCFWEDDGTRNDAAYSPPNRLTLGEGKQNFKDYGGAKLRVLDFLDQDRMLKYEK